MEAAISGVDYELTVNGDSASGQARITIDVLKEGWVRIPMPQGCRFARRTSMPVPSRSSTPQARGVPAARRILPGNPAAGAAATVANRSIAPATPSLLLSRPGRALLTLDVVVPITTRQGGEYLTLPASAAALVRAGLVCAARRCGRFGWSDESSVNRPGTRRRPR